MTGRSLILPGDAPAPTGPALDGWLAAHMADTPHALALSEAILDTLRVILSAVPPLGLRLARGTLTGDPARTLGRNSVGDVQKALDLAAHDHFLAALADAPVAAVLSEEGAEVVPLSHGAPLELSLDPIDGSGSIGLGAPLGTLFALWPAAPDGRHFTQPGRAAVAAGYVSFGHSVDLGLSAGAGVVLATLDPDGGAFHVTRAGVRLPDRAEVIAYNALNEQYLDPGWRAYVRDLVAGEDGPRGRDFNMRWFATAVAEAHRILSRGGAFLYPGDSRPGYGRGRLRLAYEGVPLAFLMEQAGGAATDGHTPILDLLPDPDDLHAYVPLVFGARDEVAAVARYLSPDTPQG